MNKTNQQLIKEYYEKVKEKFPNLTYEQVRDIVNYPWKYTAKHMASGELPEIRLKYFGVFRVYKKRAEYQSKGLDRKLQENKISQETYNKVKPRIEKFLNGKEES